MLPGLLCLNPTLPGFNEPSAFACAIKKPFCWSADNELNDADVPSLVGVGAVGVGPGADGVSVGFDTDPESELGGDYIHKVFTANTLITVKDGNFIFEDKGTRVTLTRKVEKQPRYWDAF